MYVIQ